MFVELKSLICVLLITLGSEPDVEIFRKC
jgi:hypothetical protein